MGLLRGLFTNLSCICCIIVDIIGGTDQDERDLVSYCESGTGKMREIRFLILKLVVTTYQVQTGFLLLLDTYFTFDLNGIYFTCQN